MAPFSRLARGGEWETVSSECVWRNPVDGQFAAPYLTRVRLRVPAGEKVIVREGLGAGEAIASTPGQAHEPASKAAETDATKRALSTFGSRFGLSLYCERSEAAKVPQERVPLGRAAARVVTHVGEKMRATAGREKTQGQIALGAGKLQPSLANSRERAKTEAGCISKGRHSSMRGPAEGHNEARLEQPQDGNHAVVEGEHTPGRAATSSSQEISPHNSPEQQSATVLAPAELPLFEEKTTVVQCDRARAAAGLIGAATPDRPG